MKDIFECIELVDEKYPLTSRLIYEEFDEIFGYLINDTYPIFECL